MYNYQICVNIKCTGIYYRYIKWVWTVHAFNAMRWLKKNCKMLQSRLPYMPIDLVDYRTY